jgi:hypothetical protein
MSGCPRSSHCTENQAWRASYHAGGVSSATALSPQGAGVRTPRLGSYRRGDPRGHWVRSAQSPDELRACSLTKRAEAEPRATIGFVRSPGVDGCPPQSPAPTARPRLPDGWVRSARFPSRRRLGSFGATTDAPRWVRLARRPMFPRWVRSARVAPVGFARREGGRVRIVKERASPRRANSHEDKIVSGEPIVLPTRQIGLTSA